MNKLKLNINDASKYEGTVTISLKKGDRVYTTCTYHNEGRWPLFTFFNLCLQGQYKEAEYYRPRFLALFKAGNEGTSIPLITDEANTSLKDYTAFPINTSRFEGSISNPQTTRDCIGKSFITYSWAIPFGNLNFNNETTPVINLICLYSSNNYNVLDEITDGNYSNPCAFIFIPQENDKTKLGNLIPAGATGSASSSKYSLYIEWKLEVKN